MKGYEGEQVRCVCDGPRAASAGAACGPLARRMASKIQLLALQNGPRCSNYSQGCLAQLKC
eukprot:1144087-Pelagomonas_calceolata.AAC.3